MKKYLLGVTAIALAFSLNAFTAVEQGKSNTMDASYYFEWDQSSSQWNQVASEEELPLCDNNGELNCSAISDQISGGQPAGTVTVKTRSE